MLVQLKKMRCNPFTLRDYVCLEDVFASNYRTVSLYSRLIEAASCSVVGRQYSSIETLYNRLVSDLYECWHYDHYVEATQESPAGRNNSSRV